MSCLNVRWPTAAMFALFYCACGTETALPPPTKVVSLEFSASSSLAGNPAPSVHVVVSDQTRARAAYAAILDLPDFPSGSFGCPADFGITYELAFSLQDDQNPLQVSIEPSGCGMVRVPGMHAKRIVGDSYWSDLAQDLGIHESDIYPYRSSPSEDAGPRN